MDAAGFVGIVLVIVAGAAAYVGLRSTAARRRGEDPTAAAADALREVGPPAIAAVLLVVLIVSAFGLMAFLFVLGLSDLLFEGDKSGLDRLVVAIYVAVAFILVGIVGTIVWAVKRAGSRS